MPLSKLVENLAPKDMKKKRDPRIRHLLAYLDGFFGNPKKTNSWLNYKNPLLGGLTPKWMIENGKLDRVIKFVETSLRENNA